jgi:hypothetical protein
MAEQKPNWVLIPGRSSFHSNEGGPYPDDQKVWRYLSFSRFAWMLFRKQLWLSRVDTLYDRWEIAASQADLDAIVASGYMTRDQAETIIAIEREHNFVSCWCASDHESHALWQIYSGSFEGVAIQTTLERLRQSVADIVGLPRPGFPNGLTSVRPVVYGHDAPVLPHESHPYLVDLGVRKRPMFEYEHEVRVVHHRTGEPQPLGHGFPWEPEAVLESVYLHPASDESFAECVSRLVEAHAPALTRCIQRSIMAVPPVI